MTEIIKLASFRKRLRKREGGWRKEKKKKKKELNVNVYSSKRKLLNKYVTEVNFNIRNCFVALQSVRRNICWRIDCVYPAAV